MNESAQIHRLIEVVAATLKRRYINQVELANEIGESAGTITNWKSRGIPKAKILELSRKFRCLPDYIEFGTPPAFPEMVPANIVAEPAVAPLSDALTARLESVTEEARRVALMWDQLPPEARQNLYSFIEFTCSAAKMRVDRSPTLKTK